MSNVKTGEIIDKNSKMIVCLFFFTFLLVGLGTYKDYGVHYDEGNNQNFGIYSERTIKHFFIKTPDTLLITTKHTFTHGPVFELLQLFITKYALHLTDARDIVLARHLLVFLSFFVGALFFYYLCRYQFENWKIALLGAAFLILDPKIFPLSFYDSNDIPFLSFYAASTFTLIKFLDKKNYAWALLHALASALLVDIRIIGLVIPLATIFFMTMEVLYFKAERSKIAKTLMCYLLMFCFFVILFWPLLWEYPIRNSHTAVIATLKISYWKPFTRYFTLYWMLMTTPVIYIVFFLIGLFFTASRSFSKMIIFDRFNRNNLIAVFLFLMPLFLDIILNERKFNQWRHFSFVYVPFVLLILNGIVELYKFSVTRLVGIFRKVLLGSLSLAVLFSLSSMLLFMVRIHPWEYSYRNFLFDLFPTAQNTLEDQASVYWDYWHLANKNVLEYIVHHDKSKLIRILYFYDKFEETCNYAWILPAEQRKRIVFTQDISKADYFVTPIDLLQIPKYYSLSVDNKKIVYVYKVNPSWTIKKVTLND